MKKIIHIITNDKFTSGYINFMLNDMKEYYHLFIVPKGNFEINLINKDNIKFVKTIFKKKELLNLKNKKILRESDKIIVSGIFGFEKCLYFLPKKILKKTYLQFWGGDFYTYRNTPFISKKSIRKYMMRTLYKKMCRSNYFDSK